MLKFVSEPEKFRAWVDGHGIYGRLAFIGMMVLQVFIAIIPGEPLEIGAGYAFGMWEGTLLCMAGALMEARLYSCLSVVSESRRWRSSFPGKNPFPAFSPKPKEAELVGIHYFCNSRYAEGSALLFCRAYRNAVRQLDADYFRCQNSVCDYFHDRRECARHEKLSVCNHGICCDNADQRRRDPDLPNYL